MKKITHKILSAALGISMIFQSAAIVRAADTSITLSKTEATVLTASDNWSQYLTGNMGLRGEGLFGTTSGTNDVSSLTFPFTVTEKQKFKISLDGVFDVGQNGGLSKVDVSITGFGTITPNKATNCTMTDTGESSSYGQKRIIVDLNDTYEFSPGTNYSLTFAVNYKGTSANTDKYQASLKSVTFTPVLPTTLSKSEATTFNAYYYTEGATNFKQRVGSGTQYHVQVTDNTKEAEISIPFNVAEEQSFKLSVDTISLMSGNQGISPLQFKIDNGEYVTLSEINASNGATGNAVDYGVTPYIIAYNDAIALSADTHTITFKFGLYGNNGTLCQGTIGDITFTPTSSEPEEPETPESYVTLATDKATVLTAEDAWAKYATGGVMVLRGGGQFGTVSSTETTATLAIPFTVEKKQEFKLSILGAFNVGQNGGLSKVKVQIDDGEAIVPTNGTNCAWTYNADGCDYGATGATSGGGDVDFNGTYTLDEGTHILKFIVDGLPTEGGAANKNHQASIKTITFTPVVATTLATDKATTINAIDWLSGSDGGIVDRPTANGTHYAGTNSSMGGYIVIPFKVAEKQQFKLSVNGAFNVLNGGYSPVNIEISGFDAFTPSKDNCSAVENGESIFGANAIKADFYRTYVFTPGDYTLKFTVNAVESGNNAGKYFGAIGDITFTPAGDDLIFKATDYVDAENGWGLKDGTDGNKIAVIYTTPGTMEIPVDVVKNGYYNIYADICAAMTADDEMSPIYYAIDDETPIKLDSTLATVVKAEVETYEGIGKLNNYKINKAYYLEADKKHKLTFSVKDKTTDDNYPVALDNITLKAAERITGISFPRANWKIDVDGTRTLNIQLNTASGTTVDKASVAAITYKSSDESVATIDANGKITAVGSGVTTISVTVKQFAADPAAEEVTASETLVVYENGVAVTDRATTATGVSAKLKANKVVDNCSVYIAKYNGTTLTGVACVYEGALTSGAEETLTAEIGAVQTGETVKVFVWNSDFAPLVKNTKF